jgi:hypothetical protein
VSRRHAVSCATCWKFEFRSTDPRAVQRAIETHYATTHPTPPRPHDAPLEAQRSLAKRVLLELEASPQELGANGRAVEERMHREGFGWPLLCDPLPPVVPE